MSALESFIHPVLRLVKPLTVEKITVRIKKEKDRELLITFKVLGYANSRLCRILLNIWSLFNVSVSNNVHKFNLNFPRHNYFKSVVKYHL